MDLFQTANNYPYLFRPVIIKNMNHGSMSMTETKPLPSQRKHMALQSEDFILKVLFIVYSPSRQTIRKEFIAGQEMQ